MSDMLSHYEILARIGAGGMGEVFRARDTRLGRVVAIKVLPAAFDQDRERVARFQREAQVLASLNHPHIARLYGLEEAEGKRFLVMELAEGESLDRRLDRGPLSVEETLSAALQIAQALEDAHDHGVVHRDLKPGNIHITEDGAVKVLDFGLAKALESEADGGATLAQSPTITRMTGGVILGTAAYMSPEQAKGKPADRRSDIWSFGVVLLEMLTGKRTFEGETVSETLASIMKDPIPWDRLPADLPPGVAAILMRCLERDPKRRLQAIGEARIALEAMQPAARSETSGVLAPGSSSGVFPVLSTSDSQAGTRAPHPAAPSRRRLIPGWIPWALAVVGVALAVAALLRGGETAKPSGGSLRKFFIQTGEMELGGNRPFVLSPDGKRIAYTRANTLWVRDLDALEPRALVSSSGGPSGDSPSSPLWSPDGTQIAYLASSRLWKVDAKGGTPAAVCSMGSGLVGAAWLDGDRIVYSVPRGDMYEVSARGGDPKVVIPRDPNHDVDFHNPWPLPGGRGVVYSLHRSEGVDTIELWAGGKRIPVLRVPRTDSGNVQVVNQVCYSPAGYLLYQRDQGNVGIWAVPFSLADLKTTGDPFLVAAYGSFPSVSADGLLAYRPGAEDLPRRMVWVNAKGEILGSVGDPARGLRDPAISPDGTRIAYSAQENGAGEIWVYNLARGSTTRLTFTPADEGQPAWIPGQDRIAYVSTEENRFLISAKSADGSGEATVLAHDGTAPTFTPDGKWMLYQSTIESAGGLMRVPLPGQGKAEMILPGNQSNLYSPVLSGDGRYVSYISWERGTAATYIRPFPTGDGKWELPGAWEATVRWRGDRVFFTTFRPEPAMMEVTAATGQALTLGTPHRLFDLGSRGLVDFAPFDVSPGQDRFLMIQATGSDTGGDRVALVENWLREFARPRGSASP